MPSHTIKLFKTGVVNRPDSEDIKQDAAKNSLGWMTIDGRIELSRGKEPVGSVGAAGSAKNVWVGYKTDGTAVLFAHIGDTIKYYTGSAWATLDFAPTGIVGEVSFANYSSLAGSFVYFSNPTFGIYKINTAFPGNCLNMTDATKNWSGYIFIDKARMWLWGRTNDKTGLYASWIDKQDGTTYTTVATETLGTGNGVQTVFSGTLGFKSLGDGVRRSCFGLSLLAPITASDNFLGVISGTGVTGTINYTTGAYSLTFSSPVGNGVAITAKYFHENTNNKGITDFTYSTTRVKGEGFILRQDVGGDQILNFLPSSDGTYVSIKERSSYEIKDSVGDDATWTNVIIRTNMGVPSKGASVSTDKGVIFINAAQPLRPELTLLVRNPIGNYLEPKNIGEHFKWENYVYDKAVMGVYGQFITLSCKTSDALVNDVTILINVSGKSAVIEPVPYGVTSWANSGSIMYGGSPLTQTVYKIFSGYDDENQVIDNTWDERDEDYGSKRLKKFLRLRLRGYISRTQKVEVYASPDRSAYTQIGSIDGNGAYVDSGNAGAIGDRMIGEIEVGGEGTSSFGYYEHQITRLRLPRFKVISIRFVAVGIGYVSIDEMIHEDILTFEDRIATRFRN